MGCGGEDGDFLSAVDHFDGNGEGVVFEGYFAWGGGDGDGVVLDAGFVGVEEDCLGEEGVVGVVVEGFGEDLSSVVGDGELWVVAFEAFGADGDFEGELVAEICYGVVFDVGDGGVFSDGGVAEGYGVDGEEDLVGYGDGVCALVEDAVAGEDECSDVAVGEAL